MKAIILVGIAYIGAKAVKQDTIFGTRLTFTPGQVHQVDAHTANQMLQHPDVYAKEDSEPHNAVLAKLGTGKKVIATPAPVTTELTAEQKLQAELERLEAEFKKFSKKEQIGLHEVTVKLGVTFEADDTRKVMTEKVLAAYKVVVAEQLGVALEPQGGTDGDADTGTDKQQGGE